MKKLLAVPVIALLVAALPADKAPEAPVEVGNQVGICHLPGHDGDFVLQASGAYCVNALGGNVILVGRAACEKGHGAAFTAGTPGRNLDCSYDNEEMVRSGPFLKGN